LEGKIKGASGLLPTEPTISLEDWSSTDK
jgi:hypothetical protein